MSKELLLNLNGGQNGRFRDWINQLEREPRIAWYPSAGNDFRDLLYLNPRYSEYNPANRPEPQHPDIFLHTDYASRDLDFTKVGDIKSDGRTQISLIHAEELPRLNLDLHNEFINFPKIRHGDSRMRFGSKQMYFLQIEVRSNRLGVFSAFAIYAFVENATFCAKKIIPCNGLTSHVIHVRYGAGLGGGFESGIWLLNVLHRLRGECFVTDEPFPRQNSKLWIYELYPELRGNEDRGQLERIRIIPSASWSGCGDVSWNLVCRG